MLATYRDAMNEYACNVGHTDVLRQWLLTDYDVWVSNPYYIGPYLGHPETGECFGDVFLKYSEAADCAKQEAERSGAPVTVENYMERCWVVRFN